MANLLLPFLRGIISIGVYTLALEHQPGWIEAEANVLCKEIIIYICTTKFEQPLSGCAAAADELTFCGPL
jgi:hypothetical protein